MPSKAAEKLLRATLWEFGVRFRTQGQVLGVTPSLVVANVQVAVFVDDCFESRCPWHFPERNSPRYWKRLMERDFKLRKAGWIVVRVWQHEVEETPRIVAGRICMVIRAARKVLESGDKGGV